MALFYIGIDRAQSPAYIVSGATTTGRDLEIVIDDAAYPRADAAARAQMLRDAAEILRRLALDSTL